MSRADVDRFLRAFFAAPNPLAHDMLSRPAVRAELDPWLENAHDPSLPLLLPRPEPSGGGVIWYAMASNTLLGVTTTCIRGRLPALPQTAHFC